MLSICSPVCLAVEQPDGAVRFIVPLERFPSRTGGTFHVIFMRNASWSYSGCDAAGRGFRHLSRAGFNGAAHEKESRTGGKQVCTINR